MLSKEQLMKMAKEVKEVATQDGFAKQITLIYENIRYIYFVDYKIINYTNFTSCVNKYTDGRVSTLKDFNIDTYECRCKRDFETLCEAFDVVGKRYATVVNGEWELI